MAELDLKWYGIFVVLFTTILSFADPITDILTLVVFYREDHKTWFGVGLAFVVLPCLVYPIIYFALKEEQMAEASRARKCTQTFLCGFNPFSPAFAKLQLFMFYLKNFKKLWRGDKIQPSDRSGKTGDKEAFKLLFLNKFAVLFEATLESAPQFVLQLYATIVQQESVNIIQMISLPVSFLSLAWPSTVADEITLSQLLEKELFGCSVKNRLLLFATHLFLLSSRLFAISLFTVSYKWWITSVLIFHSMAILVADAVCGYHRRECGAVLVGVSAFFFCLHWLRDDMFTKSIGADTDDTKKFRRMQLFSNLLYVIENIAMILLFYFSQFSNNWYALPVTVCVCLFSVLGAITRVTHFNCLIKTKRESRNDDKIGVYSSTSPVRSSNDEYRGYAVQYVSTV